MRGIRKFLITTVVAMALGLLGLPPNLRADGGALKVTSFPSGANVFVDGVDTGKVTPMTISVPLSTHTITVSFGSTSCQDKASLGWTPATHTMEVIEGTNFLSVTLLPCLTVGPQGLQGPAGPQGLTGPAGAAGPPGPAGATGPAGDAGPTGPAGPQGLTGPVGINNRGPWNAAANYNPNDAVTDQGSYWLALISNTISEPSTSNANWQLVASKGDTGATGAIGPQGLQGPIGVTGVTGPAGPAGQQGPTGMMGATGATGPQGPAGPAGPTGLTGPMGPAGGLTRRQEFPPSRQEFPPSGTFTFTVPAGITRLSVELYGAGGGGGPDATTTACHTGAGGGGGAYSSTILDVQQYQNQLLTITVGVGGTGSASLGSPGGNGGDTQVLDASGTPLAVAHGGSGGPPATNCNAIAAGGSGGVVDSNTPNPMINHLGAAGGAGVFGFFASNPGKGGMGYVLPSFPVQANGKFGAGGDGGSTSTGNGNGSPGQEGYILLTW